jgi:hypothetical protein
MKHEHRNKHIIGVRAESRDEIHSSERAVFSSHQSAAAAAALFYILYVCVYIGTDGQTEREKNVWRCVCLIWPVIKERMDHLVGPRGTGVSFVPPSSPSRRNFFSFSFVNNIYLPVRRLGSSWAWKILKPVFIFIWLR